MTSPPKATNKKAAPAASSKSGQARAAQADPPRPPTPPLPSKSTAKWKHAKQAPPKAQKRDKKGGPVRGVVEDEQQEEVVVNVSGDDDDEEEETDRARRDEIRRGKRPAVDEPYEPQGRKKRPRLEVRFKLPGDDELGDDDSVNYEDENRDEEEDEEEDDDEYEDADNVILPVFEYNRLLSAALTSEFGCWPGGRIELTPEEAQKRAESTSGKIAKEMEFWHKWSRDTNKASAKLGKALSPKDKHGLFVPLDQPYRYSVDDQEIRDLWLRLQTKVSDLVAKYFPNLDYLMDRGENPEVEEVMRILMSSSVDFSGDPLDREEALIMVEGYIWHNLRRMIFDERSGAWAGNYQRGQIHSWFNNTLMHAGDERWPELESHLHEMRARMETIMGQLNFDLHQASDSHAAIFAGPIARLVPEELADTYLEESLQIVNWAADFDRKFRRSRADWKLLPSDGLRYWPQDGQTFDSTVMEDCQDPADVEDNRPIFMFVAPGLVKRGNDEGTNYGEEEVIAKTRVWVGYQDDSSVED